MRAQCRQILAPVGGLDLAEQALERIEVFGLDFDRLGDRCSRTATEAISPSVP